MNASATPPPELHLPDLPEVSVTLGGKAARTAPRLHEHWSSWLRNQIASYLPLLLMAMLALGTWWLVRNTPRAPQVPAATAPRSEPDYEMQHFAVTRFAADGRPRVHLEGERLRHLPDVDRLEIDSVRIRALAPDGRTTVATARRAVVNGDATEVQLQGGARVQSQLPGGETLEVESEFLHAFLAVEKLRTHLPVKVRHGRREAVAGTLEVDNLAQRVQLGGPVRVTLPPVPR